MFAYLPPISVLPDSLPLPPDGSGGVFCRLSHQIGHGGSAGPAEGIYYPPPLRDLLNKYIVLVLNCFCTHVYLHAGIRGSAVAAASAAFRSELAWRRSWIPKS